MKIEAELIKVTNGEAKEIKFAGTIYSLNPVTDKVIIPSEPQPKRHYKKRSRHYKPKDAVAFIPGYSTWIKEDETQKVKNAVNKVEYGYVPTANVISKQTGIRMYRVLAILKYLRDKDMVTTKKNGLRVIYQPVVRVG